jgi:ArsR family transcriptional regulator
MKILVESGVVSARKGGKWTYYSINEAAGSNAVELLKQLTSVAINKSSTDNERCCK